MAGAMNFGDAGARVILGGSGERAAELPKNIYTDSTWISAGGLPRAELMRILTDIYYEPTWRPGADLDVDYYDGHQLDAEVLEIFRRRGIPPLVINLIQPTINAVLGLEAKTRSDAEVTYEDDASMGVALALNKKLNDAERESYADRASSEAYASQVKAGLGWVEVNDNPNPLQYKYRVKAVHRREIWWDWRDVDLGLDNGRFLVRKKWFDNDVLARLLPQYKDCIGGRHLDGIEMIGHHLDENTGMDSSNSLERAVSLEMAEWRDTDRGRSILYEVWYRVWQQSFVARLPNDIVIELDPDNETHMALIDAGRLKPIKATWPKMRQSFWLGPHRIVDRWSPLPHQHFPYIPFWGFREDLSSMPYGLIRAMRSPQDEINARRSKMMALMSARRVQIDADAPAETHNTHKDIAAKASAHDHYIVLNPNRQNKEGGLKIDNNLDLSAAQLGVLQEAKMEINQVSGIFNEQRGQAQAGMSGYAINSLVEQGNTTLAEINDNYRFARRLVYARLLEHVKRDSVHPHQVIVGEGKAKKTILLNQRAPDSEAALNDVQMSTARVVLQEVPSSQGYRQQQFMILTELCKALPPEVQQFVIDFIIEASDIPERKAVTARVRAALGLPEPGDESEQQQIPPQVQQQIQQGQEMLQQQAAVIEELSQKLQKAVGAMQLEGQRHQNRMEELKAEGALSQAKHGAALQGIEAKGAAQAAQATEGDDDVEAAALKLLQELATRMEALEKNQGPKRSIVKPRPDGTFEVMTVPVQAQAPLRKNEPTEETTQ